MTDETKFDEQAISQARDALMPIPQDAASVSESSDEYEYVIDVRPNTDDKCGFVLRFSTYETYDLYFGHGLRVEEMPTWAFPPTAVVSAILKGRVRETLRKAGKWVIGAEGEISLDEGRVLYDSSILPFGLHRLGKSETIQYVPYVAVNEKR
jgi:hypothetical protein